MQALSLSSQPQPFAPAVPARPDDASVPGNTPGAVQDSCSAGNGGNTRQAGFTSRQISEILGANKLVEKGHELWRFEGEYSGGHTRGVPAVDAEGTVYATTSLGHVYAIKEGRRIWDVRIGIISGNPVLSPDGSLLVGMSDSLCAIRDGRVIWNVEFDRDGISMGNTVLDTEPCVASDGTAYAGCRNHKLYAIKDGRALWKYDTGEELIYTPAMAPDGTVIVSANDRILGIRDGEKVWEHRASIKGKKPYRYFTSAPAVAPDGTVVVGSGDGKIHGIGKKGEKWSFETGSPVRSHPVIGSDGKAYLGSDDGKLYALSLQDGAKVWDFATGNREKVPCQGPDGMIYVGGPDDKLYALNDGKIQWTYEGASPFGITMSPDGAIVFTGPSLYYVTAVSTRTAEEQLKEAMDRATKPEEEKNGQSIEEVSEEGNDWLMVGDVKLPVRRHRLRHPFSE